MRRALHWLTVVCALFGAGCSSDDNGDGGSGANGAACVPSKLTLTGEIDGQPVDLELDWTSRGWVQLGDPHYLDVGYDGGNAHIEWGGLVGEGSSVPATGTIVMPSGAPRAGEMLCGASGSVSDRGTGYGFSLESLTLGPTCPGTTSVAGQIAGCAADRPEP